MATETIRYESPLKVIYDAKCGNLTELEEHLGRSTVRQLEAMGYIKNAPSKGGDTWSISARAENLAEVCFRPYTFGARLYDFFRYRLPRILFGA